MNLAVETGTHPDQYETAKEKIEAASIYNPQETVKCLAELRNTMKTKLEYLKFGKDLLK